jgi:hypothetical protein
VVTCRPHWHRPSPQVVRLIDRIKKLVAEQRRLDDGDDEERRRDANRREIARLKWRLANVVKRELSPGSGLRLLRRYRQRRACAVLRQPSNRATVSV